MEMHRTIHIVFLLVAVMTSSCQSFSVRRHHHETKQDSAFQSTLPSYNLDGVEGSTDSMGRNYAREEIPSESDLFEEIKEVVILAENRNSEDEPQIDTSSGNTLSYTSSPRDINTALDLEAVSPEAPSAVGSGENEAVKSERGISFTATKALLDSARVARGRRQACRNPTEAELTAMLAGTADRSDDVDIIMHSYVNRTCPNSLLIRSTSSDTMADRALCPYVMETDTDYDRFPQDISFARCVCRDCINPNSNSFITRRGTSDCIPVERAIQTLRRGPCVNGVYQYEKQTTTVPVACVCAKRRTV